MDRTALVVGVTGIAGYNSRRPCSTRASASSACPARRSTRSPASSTCRRRPRPGLRRGGRRRQGHHRPGVHHVAAPGHRGREHRRSTARCCSNTVDALGGTPLAPARRARDRAQALPRAVRGVREGSGRDAVPGEPGAASVRELLLHAGGHPVRGGRGAGLHLVGAPPAHDDRLRPRERDEHGCHARDLRQHLPAPPGAPFVFPGSRSSTTASPTSPTRACSAGTSRGRPPRRTRATRRSTPSTARSSAGASCGAGR